MRTTRRDAYWVAEMCRVIDATDQIVERGRGSFFDASNIVEFSAARMAVIDLDVAAENISNEFKASRPDLPWKALARARDKYAHHYEDIDREVVWNLLVNRLPELVTALRA